MTAIASKNRNEMSILKAYISSIRPATLLLAVACALCGGALAMFTQKFNGTVFTLTLLTASFLQIVSNLANDYGDFQHGTDTNGQRIGPARALMKGDISIQCLRSMIIFSICMAVVCGLTLLYVALYAMGAIYFFAFLLLGLCAIIAAIKYTAGKNPYGYKGLGDLFTFIFFGPVALVGSYFLQTHHIDLIPWLPSIGFGILTIAVLNINNMRDLDNDFACGKITIPVMLGFKNAKHYHATLTLGAIACFLMFNLLYLSHWYQYLYMLVFAGLIRILYKIYQIKEQEKVKLAPYLKHTVATIFIFSVTFFACINL